MGVPPRSESAARLRALVERRLAPLFAKLSLTPEQKQKLIQLVMEEHEANQDIAAAVAKSGQDVSQDPATLDKMADTFLSPVQINALVIEQGNVSDRAHRPGVQQAIKANLPAPAANSPVN